MRWIDVYARWVWHPGKWRVAAWLYRRVGHLPGPDREVVRAGLRWRLDPADHVSCDLFWCGAKDRWELYHLKRLLPRDATVLDAGANFGYYTCMLGAWLGMDGRVYAFEPFAASFARLGRNIELNNLRDRVEPVEAALSDRAGTCRMQAYEDNTAAAHVAADAGPTPVMTLDRFCEERGISRVNLLKLDVEGLELNVLRGGREMIAIHRPILLVEVHPGTLKREGATPAELLAALRALDYDIFRVARRRLMPLDGACVIDDYLNVLCLPRG